MKYSVQAFKLVKIALSFGCIIPSDSNWRDVFAGISDIFRQSKNLKEVEISDLLLLEAIDARCPNVSGCSLVSNFEFLNDQI